MILYPDLYINNIKEITIEMLNKNNIKGLILDVDNTIIDYNKNILNGSIEWCEKLKQNGIKICILSNSNKKEKVKNVAQQFNIEYIYFAKKPLKFGFNKAKQLLSLGHNNIAVVGDQIFTDVLGAHRSKMFAILTKPLEKKDIWITVLKRPIEEFIIKKYLRKKEK